MDGKRWNINVITTNDGGAGKGGKKKGQKTTLLVAPTMNQYDTIEQKQGNREKKSDRKKERARLEEKEGEYCFALSCLYSSEEYHVVHHVIGTIYWRTSFNVFPCIDFRIAFSLSCQHRVNTFIVVHCFNGFS